jgi:hypothetical protein
MWNFFKYLGRILTDDGKCTCEIKSGFAMAKAAFIKKMALFRRINCINTTSGICHSLWMKCKLYYAR